MADTLFIGNITVKVDPKGRVALPVRFRRALQAQDASAGPGDNPRLYISYGNPQRDDVECLSGDAFDAKLEMIRAMPKGSRERQLMQYLYLNRCEEVSVDEAGRFVLPVPAREKLALNGEADFDGEDDVFIISRPEDSAARDAYAASLFEQFSGGNKYFSPDALATPVASPTVPENQNAES